MAALTVNVPDEIISDLADALEAAKGREEGEGDAAMAKRHIRAFLKNIYVWHKGRSGKLAAEEIAKAETIAT